VVGRTLSSYTVAGVQNNQVTVTFTVYNEDADPLTGVLLTDTLQPGVTFLSASAQPDQSGASLAWSLGTVGGFDRASVTLTVSLVTPTPTQLDGGAAAFGTLDARAVTNTTPPAVLSTRTIAANLLASTPDANTTDPFVQEEAAKLSYDPQQIFTFLHTSVGYNSYLGSVRGARGTLWSSAGNALDVASLGVALLRASGVPAQYAQGTLTQSQAQQLILSMFPASYQTLGYLPAGTQTADPAHDPQLLAETTAHYWFQFDAGGGMQDADPLMAGASVGQAFTASAGTFAVVPDSLREKTEVKLTAEIYSQANPAFGSSPLTTTVVLDQTFNDVDLVGRPLSVGNCVSSSTAGGLIISSTTNTYSPYIAIGDEADPAHDQLIRGTDYQEVLTNYPLGSQILSGLFLEVDLSGPQGPTESFVRALVDRIGFAGRQNGVSGTISADASSPPIIRDTDLYTVSVLPGSQGAAPMQPLQGYLTREQTLLRQLTAAQGASSSEAVSNLHETLASFARLELVQFLTLSGQSTANLASLAEVQAYYDRPRVTIFSNQYDSVNQVFNLAIDLRRDQMRVLPCPGQSSQAVPVFNTPRGFVDNILEQEVLPAATGVVPLGTYSILTNAVAEGIPFVVLSNEDSAVLAALNLPAESKARISTALGQGALVVTPAGPVVIAGVQTSGWLEVNPTTGQLAGALQNGIRSVIVQYSQVESQVVVTESAAIGQASQALTAATPAQLASEAATVKTVLAGGLAAAAGGAAAVSIVLLALGQEFGGTFAALMAADFTMLAGAATIDPPVIPFLLGVRPPRRLNPPNTGQSHPAVPATAPAGAVSGQVVVPSLAVFSPLAATWSSAATSGFQAQAVNAPNATVTDSHGNVVGTGAVVLAAAGPIPVAISGNDQYSVNGTGRLAFYGPAASSLGVSGNWDNYSAASRATSRSRSPPTG
jgi:uncharacterized repeat protein (TIGR01451 family)